MSTTETEPAAYTANGAKSLAQQILDTNDVESNLFPVPEWGVTLELRSPNGEERAALQTSMVDIEASQGSGGVKLRDLKAMYPSLVATCAYDPETGERVFEMTPATVAALNTKNGAVLERVALACMELCGLRTKDVDAKKDGSSTSPTSESPTP